ncbi:MAG: hypothetical protein HXS46_01195 [Theionarchaea archaeon]|nr:MAG: hypothetical protein AYK18_13055 [Theionarchaea archaeon DG-70]MBU7009276.1 hypothetical protein [Theionarchaea archaeon]
MSTEIEDVRSQIKGIKAVILTEDEEIVLSEFDDVRAKQLSYSLNCLVDAIKETHDFEGMMIAAKNGKFFIFNHGDFLLGVLSDEDTNFTLLKLLVRKAFPLQEQEESEDKTSPEEELPFFLRVSCSDYYKKYPRDRDEE